MIEQNKPGSRRPPVMAAAASYLPRLLLDRLPRVACATVPWTADIDGTLLMADVSGFTVLSEQLATSGKEGAERLTTIINRYFGRMLDIASAYGGDAITFAGDAVLLLFSGDGHARRAVASGLEMLRTTGQMPVIRAGAQRIKLGMSVGAHSARFLVAAAGVSDDRMQLYLLGPEAEKVVEAEALATKGQLAVSAATVAHVDGDSITLTPAANGHWLAAGDPAQIAAQTPRTRKQPPTDHHAYFLLPFAPPWVAEAARSGAGLHLVAPEHRRVWVVFVNVTGVNEILARHGTAAAACALQSYVEPLVRLLDKHHGYLVSNDISTTGFKLILTFGAPVAHEFAAANAARFALELEQSRQESRCPLQHRIGINGGSVFAGEVGPDFRRQYTIMGDEVNLAARLMAAAGWGQILVSRRFAEHAGAGFIAKGLEPIRVKGKSQPIEVCLLEGEGSNPPGARAKIVEATAKPTASAAVFGRAKELETLATAWAGAQSGAGVGLLILGEAGIGKTTVLETALTSMIVQAPVIRTACYEHLRAIPYAPWVEALDQLFGTNRADSLAARTSRVSAWISRYAPGVSEFAPLLNPLLAVSFEMTDVVRSLEGLTRKERLHDLVGQLLANCGSDGPLAVVFEDIHWADESSIALLKDVLQQIEAAPVLLLATARPLEQPLDLGPRMQILPLRELSSSDSAAMVRTALNAPDLPDELVDSIYEKTKGNPLFTEEVIRELAVPGVLERILSSSSVSRAREMAAIAIPDRVQGLLMSQLDRLSPDSREVAKAGSVIGRDFSRNVLEALEDKVIGASSLDFALGELVATSLVVTDPLSVPSSYRFRHALVQEVAYDSLPFARRRSLHQAVARLLEAGSANPDHGVLVHHYRNAEDKPELRAHAAKAAQESIATYGYREAVDYLDLAAGATQGRRSDHANLRSRFNEMAADCYGSLGQQDEAIARYVGALRSWASPSARLVDCRSLAELPAITRPDEREADLCRKIALAALRSWSDQRRTLLWARKAERCMPDNRPAVAAKIGVVRCGAYSRVGRHDRALATAEEALVLARESGDDALLVHALNGLVNACGWLGLFDRVLGATTEAVELSQKIGDLADEATAQGNMAIYYELTGDFGKSLRHYELSLALYRRLGDSVGAAHQENNISNTYLTMSRPAEAALYAEQAVKHLSEEKSPNLAGCAALNLARAKIQLGDLDSAASILAKARVLLQRAESHDFLLYADLGEAELELARGNVAAARTWASDLLVKSRAMGVPFEEVEVLLFLGSLELGAGNLSEAKIAIEGSISKASEVGSMHDRGLGLLLLADLQSRQGMTQTELQSPLEILDEACELFRRCRATVDLARARKLRGRISRRMTRMGGDNAPSSASACQ